MRQAKASGAWTRLEGVLKDRRIDRVKFEAQAVRVIEAAWRTPADRDPAAAFTFDEVAILGDAGLDLSPRRTREADVILSTATDLALIETKAASVADVAATLGVSRARIRQRAVARTLYAVRVDEEWRFPLWQFDDDGRPVAGIATIAAALPPDLHPVAVRRFMSEPNSDLEILDEPVSPLAWLQSGGDPVQVASIARAL